MGWVFLLVVVAFVLCARRWTKVSTYEPSTEAEGVAYIRRLRDADDLRDYVAAFIVKGAMADELVAKAMEFRDELSEEDWVVIYEAIDEPGPAQETAQRMAGDALEPMPAA